MPNAQVQRLTSPAQEDYLKALLQLGGRERQVGTTRLSQALRVSPASASEMLVKLAARQLVTHDPGRGALLTPDGAALAVEMVRHHRIIETYLVHALGYSWDEVHEEADRLEHSISELLEERMWLAVGRPATDPHGHPIPTREGGLVEDTDRDLTSGRAGDRLRLRGVSDHDPGKLRAIADLGIRPGDELLVTHGSEWEGAVGIEIQGRMIEVAPGLARSIFVEIM